MIGRGRTASIGITLATVLAAPLGHAQEPRKQAQQARPQQQPAANPGPVDPAAAPDPAKLKGILKDWEKISVRLKTLEVDIRRVDKSDAWGDEEFVGIAKLKSPNLAYLNFDKAAVDPKNGKKKLDANGKPVMTAHERIVCTGTEVWQYVSETKQLFIFPLDKEDQARALEEGPLPFLFNMKAAETEARYTMKLVKEEETYFIIGVLPKLKIDKAGFSQALIKLNKKNYFPDMIVLVTPDHKGNKTFTLTNPKANREIDPRYFKGMTPPKPWTVVRDPGNGPAAPPLVGAAGAADAQPKRAVPGGGAVRPR